VERAVPMGDGRDAVAVHARQARPYAREVVGLTGGV
jgi:hypothetical protein